jgi:predicted DCC family thiol-disulfide oxidoreductase YuxK
MHLGGAGRRGRRGREEPGGGPPVRTAGRDRQRCRVPGLDRGVLHQWPGSDHRLRTGRRRSSLMPADRYVLHSSWLGDAAPPQRPLLLFDGGCPFCRAAARLVARLDRDGRLAMLDRDDNAASHYVARIPEQDVQASWQLIEPTGVRLMHGPAGIRLLGYLPATAWLGRSLRRLRLTALVTAVNRLLGRLRKPLGRFFPDQRRPAVGRSLVTTPAVRERRRPRREATRSAFPEPIIWRETPTCWDRRHDRLRDSSVGSMPAGLGPNPFLYEER